MITLAEMRSRVTSMLAEESQVFWSQTERNRAINDAQKFVAALTQGVEVTLSSAPKARQMSFSAYAAAGVKHVEAVWGAESLILPAIDEESIRTIDRHWQRPVALPPRWIVIDTRQSRATLYPSPHTTLLTSWFLRLRVIPWDATDNDELFLGRPSMEKFLVATALIACAYLLLKERFDNEAEKYYQMGVQELQILGVDSGSIPPLQRGIGPEQQAGS